MSSYCLTATTKNISVGRTGIPSDTDGLLWTHQLRSDGGNKQVQAGGGWKKVEWGRKWMEWGGNGNGMVTGEDWGRGLQ